MKSTISMRAFNMVIACLAITLLVSCEQQYFEPKTNALPGGGTVSTYKAYTLESTDPDGDNVYGRIVFYKYNSSITLVQMGLYNTDEDASYTAEIIGGAIVDGSVSVTKELGVVSGITGEFVSSKYLTISDAAFFDALPDFNANVKVKQGATAVAAGDIGANADPVAQQD